jgi:hypothetical protein
MLTRSAARARAASLPPPVSPSLMSRALETSNGEQRSSLECEVNIIRVLHQIDGVSFKLNIQVKGGQRYVGTIIIH